MNKCFILLFALAVAQTANAEKGVQPLWKFPTNTQYIYEFTQQVSSEANQPMANIDPNMAKSFMEGGGEVIIDCKGKDAKLTSRIQIERMIAGGMVFPVGNMPQQPQMKATLKPDGTGDQKQPGMAGNMMMFFGDSLFPMPPEALIKGKAVSVPLDMAMPGTAGMKGTTTYKLNGTKKMGKLECIDYNVSMQMEMQQQELQQMQIEMQMRMEFNCLFDPKHGFFISVDGITTADTTMNGQMQMTSHMTQKTYLRIKTLNTASGKKLDISTIFPKSMKVPAFKEMDAAAGNARVMPNQGMMGDMMMDMDME